MTSAVVLQARLDSGRLPGKSLLPLGGEPLIFRVMEAFKTASFGGYILACPEECAEVFAPLAERAGFLVYPGSKEDVLSRYCGAIRRYNLDWVIRATGDNPFVFADAAEALHRSACALDADYAGYAGLPHGAGVESVKASALLEAERNAVLQSEREHVCPYLYNHPELFYLHRPLAPALWRGSGLRVTVDTREDYEKAKTLYERLEKAGTPCRHQGKYVIAAAEALR
ncbi:MAG: NTP transferase domain-containing protein [Spirochaetaceae bacterium]|jgi:spore coat polysaccharide biosynthesis protein SpsF|nr:NTP transferase domain-containing protein [Spirochaetaceae bacterium]